MHSLPFGVLWTENRAQYLHLYQWMWHIPIDFGGDNCSRGKSLWEGRQSGLAQSETLRVHVEVFGLPVEKEHLLSI